MQLFTVSIIADIILCYILFGIGICILIHSFHHNKVTLYFHLDHKEVNDTNNRFCNLLHIYIV